jgi:proteasome accessory factor B
MKTRLITRTERLSLIERLLVENTGGLRAVEIARAVGVDRRTVYRDLAVLTGAGQPVYQRHGRFFIDRDTYLSTMRLGLHEAMTLFLAMRLLTHHAEQANPHLLGMLKKLSAVLPDLPASHIDFVAELVRLRPSDREFLAVLETIMRAWGERRLVEIWPHGSGSQEAPREFATYFIEIAPGGGIYAIGYDLHLRRVQSYRIRRVKRARLLRTSYNVPLHFNPRRYLLNGWEMAGSEEDSSEVELLFTQEATPVVQRGMWHPSQRLELIDGGRCRLRLRLGDPGEALPWIRSWGSQVEVVAPASLREKLASEAAQTAAIYRAGA